METKAIGYVDKHGAHTHTAQSVRALDYARARGDLPFYRRGRKVFFSLADLDKWLSRFRVDPTEAMEA